MSDNDEVNIDNIEFFQMFSVSDDPEYLVLRIKTRDGRTFNFGLARKYFSDVVKVWNHDLAAIDQAIANGQPIPETARKAS